MKRRLLAAAVLMGAWSAHSQVGIGTLMPNTSAQLDVVTNDKGVLLPRVALTSTTDETTITNGNVNSLLVYNTNTQNDVTPGYYYWYEDRWARLTSSLEIPDNIVIWNPVNNQFTYIDENGDTQIINIENIVQANESQTLIVTIDGDQYYISEEYLQANNGVAPTTVDPEALPDGVYYIDAVAGVINNFNEFVNEGPVTVVINEEGDTVTYETVEEYLTSIVEANESQTLIVTIDGNQYYISEEYLQANEGVAPTTVDPEALPDGVYYIDAVAGVI